MTNDWFGEYVYQVVVHKDILDSKTADVLNQECSYITCVGSNGSFSEYM